MFDLAIIQRNLNELRPVTVDIARLLLRGGQEAIDGALRGAKQPWYKSDLPGDAARQGVYWKLRWHADEIEKASKAPYALYPAGDDLKKWTTQAFVEANAVETGAAYLEAAWASMWNSIQTQLRAIPREVLSAAVSGTGSVLSAALGVPVWAVWVGGAFAVGLTGLIAWRLANSPAGQAAIGGLAGRVGRR